MAVQPARCVLRCKLRLAAGMLTASARALALVAPHTAIAGDWGVDSTMHTARYAKASPISRAPRSKVAVGYCADARENPAKAEYCKSREVPRAGSKHGSRAGVDWTRSGDMAGYPSNEVDPTGFLPERPKKSACPD